MQPLKQFSVLCIEGADAGAFLHAQLSNNIATLGDGGSVMAAYCEPAGRVLAVVLVHRSQSSYYLVINRSLEDVIAKRLRLYVLRSAVDISSCTGSRDLYGYSGADAAYPGCWPYPVDSARGFWLADGVNSPPHQSGALSTDEWALADIRSGLTWLDSSTSGQFLPQALNLLALAAVDFNKGCYPGQEIIARSHYLGSVKRQLIRIEILESKEVAVGQELYLDSGNGPGQLAGKIVSAASDGSVSVILAVVKTSVWGHKLIYYINDDKLETIRISDTNKLS